MREEGKKNFPRREGQGKISPMKTKIKAFNPDLIRCHLWKRLLRPQKIIVVKNHQSSSYI